MTRFKDERISDNFNGHSIEIIEGYDAKTKKGEYRWGKSDSGIHETYIVFRPDTIILYGGD